MVNGKKNCKFDKIKKTSDMFSVTPFQKDFFKSTKNRVINHHFLLSNLFERLFL